MIELLQPLEPRLSRAELARRLRGPRLEWDSLACLVIPAYLGSEREPAERLRDVMLGGPWSHRGTPFELREADRHERLRRAVLDALGFYDWHRRPDFGAPEYERRRERAREILRCGGAGASSGGGGALAASPVSLPWHCSSASDCYDARLGVTLASGKVTSWASQGTRGNAAANASSVLTPTAAWSGALDAVTSAAAANNYLTCAGGASAWRIHSGNPWSFVTVGQCTSVAATRQIWANRQSANGTGKGASLLFLSGTGYRFRVGNGTTAVYGLSHEVTGNLEDAFVGKFVWGARMGGGSAVDIVRTPGTGGAGTIDTTTQADQNAPSDTDALAMTLCAQPAGAAEFWVGHLAHSTFHQINSAGWLQSLVDHMRALARL